MQLRKFSFVGAAMFLAISSAAAVSPVKAAEFITLGTGGVTGAYYGVGGAICRLVNKDRKTHGVRCSVESTGGSVYNVNTIRAGEMDVAIAQSDVQWLAYKGVGKFKESGPFKELRSIFAVHPEAVTIIARKEANIKHVDDLVGKRVNIGDPGSGTLAVWETMWPALGHSNDDLKMAAQLKSAETPAALCDDKIDAINWVAGHPFAGMIEASSNCGAVLAEVSGPKIDALVASKPYFRYATIPGGLYKGTPNDVKSFGVGAVFISSTKSSPDTVYQLVKAVFENFDAFKGLHPALATLKKEEMIENAKATPFHEGAVRYFKENGLM
ncbi:TAXI family TRAP transporter solute-binding subunit [Thalassospiraceae bacterium LMO-JJ14]|nr:TAXI family TRAP transporter solute-binding subunit [Thalassospiraceae bacterium LMO-JJ14]